MATSMLDATPAVAFVDVAVVAAAVAAVAVACKTKFPKLSLCTSAANLVSSAVLARGVERHCFTKNSKSSTLPVAFPWN